MKTLFLRKTVYKHDRILSFTINRIKIEYLTNLKNNGKTETFPFSSPLFLFLEDSHFLYYVLSRWKIKTKLSSCRHNFNAGKKSRCFNNNELFTWKADTMSYVLPWKWPGCKRNNECKKVINHIPKKPFMIFITNNYIIFNQIMALSKAKALYPTLIVPP